MARWYSGKTCRLSLMLSMTFCYFLVEIVYGYITNSMALVADSFHMLSDVLALIVAFFCMKISKKRRSTKNTFGWVRAEVLGALINAVFLLALCFSILIEAIKRLCEAEMIQDPVKILIVGAIGFLVNIIGIFMFHGHASVHGHSHARPVPLNLEEDEEPNGRYEVVANEAHSIAILSGQDDEEDNEPSNHQLKPIGQDSLDNKNNTTSNASQLNMHGVFLHVLGDAFGSVIVIINAVVNWRIDNDGLRKYLDPSLSILMVLIISATTLPLLKESALILLQTVPTHINVHQVKEKLLKSIDGVLAVHDFHVWRLAGDKIIATAHIRCRNLADYMKVAENIKEFFHNEGIHSTTIQPEFLEMDGGGKMNGESTVQSDCVLVCPSKCDAEVTCCETVKSNGSVASGAVNGAGGENGSGSTPVSSTALTVSVTASADSSAGLSSQPSADSSAAVIIVGKSRSKPCTTKSSQSKLFGNWRNKETSGPLLEEDKV